MNTPQGQVPEALTGDKLREIARSARTSASDSASPEEYVLAGWRAAQLAAPPAMDGGEDADPIWVVNDLGELGVQVGWRFFFLYKGGNIEYGKDADGPTAMHDDETPMRYRMVGKREFGETCWPLAWVLKGRSEVRYTTDLVYTPGLSFGKPEDGDWRDLPAARAAQKEGEKL